MIRAKVNRLKDLLTHREHTILETEEIIQLAREYFAPPAEDDWTDCHHAFYYPVKN